MAAIGEDPTLADCHYNLARLYEVSRQAAARHPASRPIPAAARAARPAERITWRSWVGTSGYNYPEWSGSVSIPEKIPTAKMLPYYAERFATVEINNTFYRMPNEKLAGELERRRRRRVSS